MIKNVNVVYNINMVLIIHHKPALTSSSTLSLLFNKSNVPKYTYLLQAVRNKIFFLYMITYTTSSIFKLSQDLLIYVKTKKIGIPDPKG